MSRSQVLESAIGSIEPEEPPAREFVSVEMLFAADVIAYLAGNRHHGYRIGCLQQRMLASVSVFAVSARGGRERTISLNRNRG